MECIPIIRYVSYAILQKLIDKLEPFINSNSPAFKFPSKTVR